jgi:hypothetical protein
MRSLAPTDVVAIVEREDISEVEAVIEEPPSRMSFLDLGKLPMAAWPFAAKVRRKGRQESMHRELQMSARGVDPKRKFFGTTSVQLRERKNGFLAPKRHQVKHLDFSILLFGTRGRRFKSSLPDQYFQWVKFHFMRALRDQGVTPPIP